MRKKEKLVEICAIVLVGVIVHIPFAIVSTFVSFILIARLGVDTDVAIMFIVWSLFFTADDDRAIAAIWKGGADER